jgi:N-acetylmuramoyl-L-alanine amidase
VKDKYTIVKKHITNSRNRSRQKRDTSSNDFGVDHETANNTADALAHYRYFQNHPVGASYHWLCDSNIILELIPPDEKAWHVRKDMDRRTLGMGYANDTGFAISMCRTGSFAETYDRFVWANAKYCVENKRNPRRHLTSHHREDPQRRRDVVLSWLEPNGVSWAKFINDVEHYVKNWEGEAEVSKPSGRTSQPTGREDLILNGDRGDHVKQLQNDLMKAGFNLPRWGADGVFGKETEDAVRAMQKSAGILIDGIFGPQSADALADILQPKPKRLEMGASGPKVTRLQNMLMLVGEQLPRWGADGKFGKETEDAVKAFQARHSISSPRGNFFGVAGNQTLSKLEELLTYTRLIRFRQGQPMLRGDDVRMVQRQAGANPDGVFGPKSRDAVRSYQRENGLTIDGIVGPQTWNHMFKI